MLDTYAMWAARLYPWRWRFGLATLTVFVVLFVLMATRVPHSIEIGGALAGPLISATWGVVLLCVWFEPTRGNLQTGWFITHLPAPLRLVVRWYFGLFLALWFAFGIVVWPLFAIWRGAFV
jgi:hypothetical protein